MQKTQSAKTSDHISLPLDVEIVCPYDADHRFPLSAGLSTATIERLRSEDAARTTHLSEQMREAAIADAEHRIRAEQAAAQQASAAEIAALRNEIVSKNASVNQLLESNSHALAERDMQQILLQKELADLKSRSQVAIAEAVAASRTAMVAEAEQRVRAEVAAEMDREREQSRLRILELEKSRTDAERVAEDLRRKMAQGSQQHQGESLEQDLESAVARLFPTDIVAPVEKGISGADITLTVRTANGSTAGKISVEIKNTRSFSHSWLAKVKADQIAAGTDIPVIITATMPSGMRHFAECDGVWICDVACWQPVIAALRSQLIGLHFAKASAAVQEEKAGLLYRYLTSAQFRARIQMLIDQFREMSGQLEQEKRALTKHWARRERLIAAANESVATVYGDIQGTIGAQSMPEIDALSIEAAA